MEKQEELRLREKASFYFKEKLKCHITKEPKGYLNGIFLSDLEDGGFYWFEDERTPGQKDRLFLCDIFEINDWKAKEL